MVLPVFRNISRQRGAHASRLGAAVLSGLVLAGCQSAPPPRQPAPDPVETALMEAARRSSDSIRTLAETEAAKTPPAHMSEAGVPEDLKRPLSLTYSGPIGPALEAVSRALGYEYSPVGKPPIAAITVDLKADGRPAWQILENIGTQAGSRADVNLSPARKAIELRYAQQ